MKIKPYTNIKELYKYGFKRTMFPRLLIKNFGSNTNFISYQINTKTRELEVHFIGQNRWILDNTIYDLIEAGLLEKGE